MYWTWHGGQRKERCPSLLYSTAVSRLYQDVNPDPPALRPFPYITEGYSRRATSLLVQIHTGHCFSEEYSLRHRYGGGGDEVECACGALVQTRRHILRECPEYEEHRHLLRGFSAELDVQGLLSTSGGSKAVVTFAALTGAFSITGADGFDLGGGICPLVSDPLCGVVLGRPPAAVSRVCTTLPFLTCSARTSRYASIAPFLQDLCYASNASRFQDYFRKLKV